MSDNAVSASGLAALEDRLAEDLTFLELPARSWVPPRSHAGRTVHDVVVIGAGMCGLAATAKLILTGIDNVVAIDAAPEGREGPWVTFARMNTLRSPKTLSGPCLGLPALTFRAWFTARHGEAAWTELDKIPREMWMDYLVWYRRVLDLPVRNGVRMTALREGPDGLIELSVHSGEGTDTLHARHLVVATGRSGLGGIAVPAFLRDVDRRFWAHSADDIDFDALKGKRIGVIGAGASAMDNAATALETGAGSVDMLIRRKEMPRINKMTGIGSQGVVHGMRHLPDAWKWRFFEYTNTTQTPPPRSSTLRVSCHPNARFFLDCAVTGVSVDADEIVVETSRAPFRFDFLISSTGFLNDFDGRAEFAAIAPHVRTWRDGVYQPEMGTAVPFLLDAPYLGPSFEFLEKTPGACPMLARIHCFNDAAMLSHGKLSGDIPAVSAGADRLVRGIAASLFAADVETHFAALQAYDTPELQGDEWEESTPTLQSRAAE